jgi:hypothetical protein
MKNHPASPPSPPRPPKLKKKWGSCFFASPSGNKVGRQVIQEHNIRKKCYLGIGTEKGQGAFADDLIFN